MAYERTGREDIERRFRGVGCSKTFRHIVEEFGLAKKAVLDIGCSYGEHLTHFGPGSVGVTIAPEEAEYGAEHNLDIREGNIEDPQFSPGGPFDAMYANNIFEHLYSPHDFLIRVKGLVKSDGFIVLGVPCVPTVSFLMRMRKFRGALASNHINFFTKTTLTKTVERAGWVVDECRSFHFKNRLVDHLLDLIAPHFYVIAHPDRDFSYPEKRVHELRGYATSP